MKPGNCSKKLKSKVCKLRLDFPAGNVISTKRPNNKTTRNKAKCISKKGVFDSGMLVPQNPEWRAFQAFDATNIQ